STAFLLTKFQCKRLHLCLFRDSMTRAWRWPVCYIFMSVILLIFAMLLVAVCSRDFRRGCAFGLIILLCAFRSLPIKRWTVGCLLGMWLSQVYMKLPSPNHDCSMTICLNKLACC